MHHDMYPSRPLCIMACIHHVPWHAASASVECRWRADARPKPTCKQLVCIWVIQRVGTNHSMKTFTLVHYCLTAGVVNELMSKNLKQVHRSNAPQL